MAVPYTSTTRDPSALARLTRAGWGMLLTPDSYAPSSIEYARRSGLDLAVDNGAFSAFMQSENKGDATQLRRDWERRYGGPLGRFMRLVHRANLWAPNQVRFIVAPDIVGGGAQSLAFSLGWVPTLIDRAGRSRRQGVRALARQGRAAPPGAPPVVMIAVQDGMTAEQVRAELLELLKKYPGQIGIFVGGTTEWKWSTVAEWGRLARELGVPMHVGRVNTMRAVDRSIAAGATSFDGTGAIKFEETQDRIDRARRQLPLALNPFSLALEPEFNLLGPESDEQRSSLEAKSWSLAGDALLGTPYTRQMEDRHLEGFRKQFIRLLVDALAETPPQDHGRIKKIIANLRAVKGSRFQPVSPRKVTSALKGAKSAVGRLRSEYETAERISRTRAKIFDFIIGSALGGLPTEENWEILGQYPELLDQFRQDLDLYEGEQLKRLRWLLAPDFFEFGKPAKAISSDPLKGIFGRKLSLSSASDSGSKPLTFEELSRIHRQGMATTVKGRDQLAVNLGFPGFDALAAQLQDAADREGRYLVTLGPDSMWATREGVSKALQAKLGPEESLKFPREQLRAILHMSPAEFRDWQKAMRGKYTNPRAPGAARQVAASALKRRRTRAASTQRPGGTPVGIARARDIAGGRNLSPRTLARMRSFFARHDTPAERAARARDHMSPAAIAWDLWGGDPARSWLEEQGE